MARELDFGGWLGNWTLGMARELDFGGWLGNWTLGMARELDLQLRKPRLQSNADLNWAGSFAEPGSNSLWVHLETGPAIPLTGSCQIRDWPSHPVDRFMSD